LGFAQQSFDFAPHQFDGVEIWRISWEKPHMSSDALYGFECFGALMCREIIHDHDVARTQRWQKDLFDVLMENLGVGRTLNRHAGA